MRATRQERTMRPGRHLRRLVAGMAAVGLALVAGPVALVAPAGAQGADAHIRLAHFSPDTPEMDVYVTGADGEETRVLEGLGYGEVSDYAALPAGSYTFLLRPMGAPADSTPAVTASADLAEGAGYTFAAMGPHAQLQKALLDDDLAPPPAGQAKVRLIQASSTAGEVDVTTVDGPALAEDRAFATVTGYASIEAGEWTVNVTTAGGVELERRLDLDPGTINTLVVLESSDGEIDLTRVVDATGTDIAADGPLGARQAAPLGGVDTGAGALADRVSGATRTADDPTTRPLVLGVAGTALAALAATTILRTRRQA